MAFSSVATVVTFAPSSVSSFVDSAMALCGLPLVHAGTSLGRSCRGAARASAGEAGGGVPRDTRPGPVPTVLYTLAGPFRPLDARRPPTARGDAPTTADGRNTQRVGDLKNENYDQVHT